MLSVIKSFPAKANLTLTILIFKTVTSDIDICMFENDIHCLTSDDQRSIKTLFQIMHQCKLILIFKAAPAQAQPSTFYFCCVVVLCCVVSPVSAKLLLLYYFALLFSPV